MCDSKQKGIIHIFGHLSFFHVVQSLFRDDVLRHDDVREKGYQSHKSQMEGTNVRGLSKGKHASWGDGLRVRCVIHREQNLTQGSPTGASASTHTKHHFEHEQVTLPVPLAHPTVKRWIDDSMK